MNFELNENQLRKLFAWKIIEDKSAIKLQKKNVKKEDPVYSVFKESWDIGFPYSSSIEGVLQYIFTPSGIGTTIYVEHKITGEVIDLTEYENW